MTVMYDYTQSKFWGGSLFPYWVLIVITILGGFYGLDHVLLHSPRTALFKFIFNILTLGLWFFYDILQVLIDKENVMKYGLSVPTMGALGIGAGMFHDDTNGEKSTRDPYRFLIYSILAWFPLGFDSYIAGDTDAAFIKAILTITIIGFIFTIPWGLMTYFKLIYDTKKFLTSPSHHFFGVSPIIGEDGTSLLGPKDIILESQLSYDKIKSRIKSRIIDNVKGIPGVGTYLRIADITDNVIGIADKAVEKVVKELPEFLEKIPPGNIIKSIIPMPNPALLAGSATASLSAASNAAKAGLSSAANAANTAKAAKAGLSGAANTAKAGLSGAANAAKAGLSGATNAAKAGISGAAAGLISDSATKATSLIHKGGGSGYESDISSIALLTLFIVLIGGGTVMAVRRMNLKPSLFDKKNDTDTPPEPRSI